jgi:RNA polymerase sigma-70 factor (sigma-E family)
MRARDPVQPSEPLACSSSWVSKEPGRREGPARDALRAAYEQHCAQLVRMCSLLTGDGDAAEDIVQDVFVRGAARLAGLPQEELGPYLRAAVTNEWKNRLRRRALERRIFRRERVPEQPEHDSGDRDEMWRAILQLPSSQRACLVLRYYEDLSEQDVAGVLGCSVGTVKSQTSRALAKLRKEFER